MEDEYYLEVKSIRNSFLKLDKDISHLSDEEVKSNAEIADKKVKELNLDINTQREKCLETIFNVFNV